MYFGFFVSNRFGNGVTLDEDMEKVLSLVQYTEDDLARKMKRQFDKAIKEDRVKSNQAMRLLRGYERGLKGYTSIFRLALSLGNYEIIFKFEAIQSF